MCNFDSCLFSTADFFDEDVATTSKNLVSKCTPVSVRCDYSVYLEARFFRTYHNFFPFSAPVRSAKTSSANCMLSSRNIKHNLRRFEQKLIQRFSPQKNRKQHFTALRHSTCRIIDSIFTFMYVLQFISRMHYKNIYSYSED